MYGWNLRSFYHFSMIGAFQLVGSKTGRLFDYSYLLAIGQWFGLFSSLGHWSASFSLIGTIIFSSFRSTICVFTSLDEKWCFVTLDFIQVIRTNPSRNNKFATPGSSTVLAPKIEHTRARWIYSGALFWA